MNFRPIRARAGSYLYFNKKQTAINKVSNRQFIWGCCGLKGLKVGSNPTLVEDGGWGGAVGEFESSYIPLFFDSISR